MKFFVKFIAFVELKGVLAQCWRSGESAALPPMWPGFDSRIGRHMWISLLLLYFAPRGFSPATPVFPGYSGFLRLLRFSPLTKKPTFDLI